MRRFPIDRTTLPLIAIVGLALAVMIFLGLRLVSNPIEDAIKGDRILNMLVILEEGGVPVATELFFYYPTTGKGAVLDIPGDTGLILKTLNKVDRIDSVYAKGRPQAYIGEIERLLSTDIPIWMVLDEEGMGRTTDLLEGIELFLPVAVDQAGPPTIRLPAGTTRLDGDKLLQYAAWAPAGEDDTESSARRQRLFQGLMRRIGEKADWLSRSDVFPSFFGSVRGNLGQMGLKQFVHEISRIDIDHLVLQRITGTRRAVDKKVLLFPHYDGDLVRDIVKQTLNALGSSNAALADKIFTLEVLNGTPQKGLANRTGEIFQSFGYDVVSVGNADRDDYQATRILYRPAGADSARTVAEVIQCGNIGPDPGGISKSDADFTVLLGSDFNGRYVSGN
jgi:anionic cell wall polymer biosynthesis LytR-Cps2A-Psr (LCP) family protein